MYDVRDIANLLLDIADKRGVSITNLSLQKLLYFVHGWFFATYENPLIKSKFEAWKYGPVQRVLYDQFKNFKDRPIKNARATFIDPNNGADIHRSYTVDEEHVEFVSLIFQQYQDYSAGDLVELSHAEDSPWEYVWNQAEEHVYPGMKIPDRLILEHFKNLGSVLTFH